MTARDRARITAVVTAHSRIAQTLTTIEKLAACDPAPMEILVHVDDNQLACADAIRRACPKVRVMVSREGVGPGGGRNRLIAEATQELVASFDDDSYPIDTDYFGRVVELFTRHPEAEVVCANVFQKADLVGPDLKSGMWVADFEGGGSVYRRAAFEQTGGYLPLALAYGMEEVDLALRLHARGGRVLKTAWLRVFHDSDLSHHADPSITAASIANLALLAWLRYPVALWPVGAAQCANRIQWLLRNGRRRGIVAGLRSVPAVVRRYWGLRRPLPAAVVRSYLRLRRHPVPVNFP